MTMIKSKPNRMAVAVDSDGEVVIDFYFDSKMIRIGLPLEDSARLRGELARAENILKAGGSTKQ